MSQAATDERTTYKAHCHCGAVRFNVTLKYPFPKYTVNQCNCSICTKNGYLLVYPLREDLEFTQGEDNLTSYYFATKNKAHRFCKTCGGSILIDPKDVPEDNSMKNIFAVNVRNFVDVDLDKMTYTHFDGKNKLKPEYQV